MTEASGTKQASEQPGDNTAIRPFHISFPASDITELRRRVNATKWPEHETVTDAHRTITGGVGHNLPQEAPKAFAEAIVDVDALARP